jgi:cytochrome c-type biogenesis protein CcmH
MPQGGAQEVASSADPVRGRVVLDPSLAGRVPPHATLFVIARRGDAGPPLAVKRVPDPTFPYDFEIGPDDRMIRQMPFAVPIQLSARLDADGNATTRSPGDLQGSARSVANPGDSNVEIVIDQAL